MEKERKAVQPKFVLLLGRTALKTTTFWNKASITKIRGQVHEENGVYYMATYHPAACLPGRDTGREKKRPAFRVDLRNFFDLVKTGKPKETEGLNVQIVRNADTFNEMIDDLRESEDISYDLETMGLKQHIPKRDIVLAGFGTERTQWVVPINYPTADGGNKAPFKTRRSRQMAWDLIGEAIRGKKVIAHNGKFDLLWSWVRYRVLPKLGDDTMLLHYLLDENSSHKLKYLCSMIFHVPDWSLDLTGEWWLRYPMRQVAKYLGRDLFYTRKLRDHLVAEIRKDPALYRFYRRILKPAYEMYVEVEDNGMYLHRENYKKAKFHVWGLYGQAIQNLNRIDPAVNWNSPKQINQKLYEEFGFPILKRTKKGAPSSDEATLMLLSEPTEERIKIERPNENKRVFGQRATIVWWEGYKHEIVTTLLQYRAAKKMKEFIDSWESHEVNGRVHPSYKFLTVTGRLSCEDPNIQQTPRDPILRSCYDAPFPYVFVEADHSQVELRGVAMFSGEPTMRQTFIDGEDIHWKTVTEIIGVKNPSKEDRKKAKAVNFGFIYGMGWKKFLYYARTKYGVEFTPKEAKLIRRRFFERYAGLRRYYEKQERVLRFNEYVRHPLGRVRHLPNIHSDDESEVAEAIRLAINSPVQGFASDYNLAGMLDVRKKYKNDLVKIVSTVHDSGLLWIHVLHLRKILPDIKRIMEHPPRVKAMGFTPSVPWKVDFKIGPWGAGLEIEDPNKWDDWKTFVKDMKEAGLWERYKQAREERSQTLLSPSAG